MFSFLGQPHPVPGKSCSAYRLMPPVKAIANAGNERAFPGFPRGREPVPVRAVAAGLSILLSTGGEMRKLRQP